MRTRVPIAAWIATLALGCMPPLFSYGSNDDDDSGPRGDARSGGGNPCDGETRACGAQGGRCYACNGADPHCGPGCTVDGTSYPWCCYPTAQAGYTTGSLPGGGNVDPGTSCVGGNLQCSQLIGACALQSCTCYYSGPEGDTCSAWYRVGSAYFPCAHCGPDYISCDAAARAATEACL